MSEDEKIMNDEPNLAPEPAPAERVDPAAQEDRPELIVVDGTGESAPAAGAVRRARFAPLQHSTAGQEQGSIDLLLDVRLDLRVELGRASVPVRDVLQYGPGSIVSLEKLSGEAVDVLVNGKLIAKGEVVVVDENFGVRVTEMVNRSENSTQVG